MANISDLIQRARTIRIETKSKKNTADRIGGLLLDIVRGLGEAQVLKKAQYGGIVATSADVVSDYAAKGYSGPYFYLVGSSLRSLVVYQYAGTGTPAQAFGGAAYDFADYSEALRRVEDLVPKIGDSNVDLISSVVSGHYYACDVLGSVPTYNDNASWSCAEITVKKGEEYHISGYGGTIPKLWATTGSDKKVLANASSSGVQTANITISQDGYLYVNFRNADSFEFSRTFGGILLELKEQRSSIDNLTNTLDATTKKADNAFDKKILYSFNTGKFALLKDVVVGSTSDISFSNFQTFGYVDLQVKEGDVFFLTTSGSTANTKTYAIFDINGVCLDVQKKDMTNEMLIIPQGGVRLIVNSTFAGNEKIEKKINRVLDNESRIKKNDGSGNIRNYSPIETVDNTQVINKTEVNVGDIVYYEFKAAKDSVCLMYFKDNNDNNLQTYTSSSRELVNYIGFNSNAKIGDIISGYFIVPANFEYLQGAYIIVLRMSRINSSMLNVLANNAFDINTMSNNVFGIYVEKDLVVSNSLQNIVLPIDLAGIDVGSEFYIEVISCTATISKLQYCMSDENGENRVYAACPSTIGKHKIYVNDARPRLFDITAIANAVTTPGKLELRILFGLGKKIYESYQNSGFAESGDDTNYSVELSALNSVALIETIQSQPLSTPYILGVTPNTFNDITNTIISLVNGGETDILVRLQEGTYYYTEKTLYLNNVAWSGIKIQFVGIGNVNLIADGSNYNVSDASSIEDGHWVIPYDGTYSYNHTFVIGDEVFTSDNNNDFKYAKSIVTSSDGNDFVEGEPASCKMQVEELDILQSEATDIYIELIEWYTKHIYKVTKIESGYVYFSVENMSKLKTEWTVNGNYFFCGRYPSYRLLNTKSNPVFVRGNNIYVDTKLKGQIHECIESNFAVLKGTIDSICFHNIRFIGSACDTSSNVKRSIFLATEFNAQNIVIEGCSVKGVNNDRFVYGVDSQNIKVTNCCFENCGGTIFVTDPRCVNIEFVGNSLIRCNGGVSSSGQNVLIKRNTFVDMKYVSISFGLHYQSTRYQDITGIVEKNLIFNNNDFARKLYYNGRMDLGAIYTSTLIDSVHIRHNVIVNYGGAKSNRAIFCDDGGKNIKIYGNLIIGTINSYDIDIRKVDTVSSVSPDHNTNNVIIGNIITGNYRFVGIGQDDGCIKGQNIVLRDMNISDSLNVDAAENDYYIRDFKRNEEILYLPIVAESRLDNLQIDSFVRGFLCCNNTITV